MLGTKLGTAGEKGYRIWSLPIVDSRQLNSKLAAECEGFGCAVAWDSRDVSAERIAEFANTLILTGCAFVGFWGPGCERAHDIFEEEEAGDANIISDGPVIMSSWHAQDSWLEALDFLMDYGAPAEGWVAECRDLVLVTVRSDEWAAQAALHIARRMLRNVTYHVIRDGRRKAAPLNSALNANSTRRPGK